MGDAMRLRQLQEAPRLELPHQHDGAAARERGQEADQRGVGVERRRAERDGRAELALVACHLAPAHPVGLDDAFRYAGRAGRVDDVERVIRADRHALRRRAGRREPPRERLARSAAIERDAAAMDGAAAQRRGGGAIQEQVVGLRVSHHRRHLVAGGRWRDRGGDVAGPQRTEEHRGVFDRGARDDRHRLVRPRPVPLQRGGDPVHESVELGIGQPVVVKHQRRAFAALAGMRPDQFRQRAELARHQRLRRLHRPLLS